MEHVVICVYVCVYIYTHTYTHTYIYIYTYTQIMLCCSYTYDIIFIILNNFNVFFKTKHILYSQCPPTPLRRNKPCLVTKLFKSSPQ